MNIIGDMFEVVGEAITSFVQALGSALTSVTSLFYVEASGSGSDAVAGHFTVLGVLLLIGVGVGLIYWAIRLIRGLIAQRRG